MFRVEEKQKEGGRFRYTQSVSCDSSDGCGSSAPFPSQVSHQLKECPSRLVERSVSVTAQRVRVP